MEFERRDSRRIPFKGYVNRVQGGIATICRAVNLSRTGICFDRIAGPVKGHGEVISVEFQLPTSEKTLVARGRAVNTGNGRVRVRFTSISPEHRAMIGGYIDSARIVLQAY